MQINNVNNDPVLNILDFNCKNILTSIPLFDELDKSVDMYLLQERWLFECQLHLLQKLHHNYNGTGNAVNTYDPIAPYLMPRGHRGVPITWKKTLDNFITPLTIGNERIQCIELSGKKSVILISVYLPCKGSDNHLTKLKECIDLLHEIMETYKNSHQIVIDGDFNENIINHKEGNILLILCLIVDLQLIM